MQNIFQCKYQPVSIYWLCYSGFVQINTFCREILQETNCKNRKKNFWVLKMSVTKLNSLPYSQFFEIYRSLGMFPKNTYLLMMYIKKFWYTQNIPTQKSAIARFARKKFVLDLKRRFMSITRITRIFPKNKSNKYINNKIGNIKYDSPKEQKQKTVLYRVKKMILVWMWSKIKSSSSIVPFSVAIVLNSSKIELTFISQCSGNQQSLLSILLWNLDVRNKFVAITRKLNVNKL